MKQIYTIRAESSNPEFETDSRLREGIQVDGFFLLAIRDGKPAAESMNGMSIIELAKFFCMDDEACSALLKAAAIGEGLRKAEKIGTECEKNHRQRDIAREIAEKMRRAFDGME
jgi:hypothetical protein